MLSLGFLLGCSRKKTMKTMKLPIINLNGTKASILLEQQIQVIQDLRLALGSLAESTPHGRDYPVEDSYWRAARQEHFARMIKVREILLEVESIAEHCSDAVAARGFEDSAVL